MRELFTPVNAGPAFAGKPRPAAMPTLPPRMMTVVAAASPLAVTPSPASLHPLDHEARLLAQLLDSARVVLVLGGNAGDRTSLLRERLPHQLGQASASRCVVHVNQWGDAPTATLVQALQRALPDTAACDSLDQTLIAAGAQHRCRFVLLLDGLEAVLQGRASGTSASFMPELATCINRLDVPASFVLALDESAHPALAPLRSLVPHLDDMSVRLRTHAPGADAPMHAAPNENLGRESKESKAQVDKPVIRSDDVYALINDALSRVATGAAANPLQVRRQQDAGEPVVETFVPPPEQTPESPAAQGPHADLRGPKVTTPLPAKSLWRRLLDHLGPRAS